MTFDFDRPVNRDASHSVKFDGRQHIFGTTDVLPMWVADMDFAVPDCVARALAERAAHPVFGYTHYPEGLYQSLIDWLQRRHQWTVEREWIMMAPGVVPSLNASCLAFAEEGQGVIVQPPVYFPFFSAVTNTRRKLLLNPLTLATHNVPQSPFPSGRYEIDFAQLEVLASEAKLLMLCSPHNPVGRVWSRYELQEVLRIAKKFNLIILSDDIHADLVYPGITHTMLGTMSGGEFEDFIHTNVITAVAPSKTFNIPGLGLSSLIVPNPEHRKRLAQVFELLHLGNHNPFSIAAYEAGYNGGAPWLDALKIYLQQNKNIVSRYLAEHGHPLKLIEPEGTYLLWLDCQDLGLSDAALRDFFVQRCRLGLSPGIQFGAGGSGFMRMNIGTTRDNVESALQRIDVALAELAR